MRIMQYEIADHIIDNNVDEVQMSKIFPLFTLVDAVTK
jgi:hypothetical protein